MASKVNLSRGWYESWDLSAHWFGSTAYNTLNYAHSPWGCISEHDGYLFKQQTFVADIAAASNHSASRSLTPGKHFTKTPCIHVSHFGRAIFPFSCSFPPLYWIISVFNWAAIKAFWWIFSSPGGLSSWPPQWVPQNGRDQTCMGDQAPSLCAVFVAALCPGRAVCVLSNHGGCWRDCQSWSRSSCKERRFSLKSNEWIWWHEDTTQVAGTLSRHQDHKRQSFVGVVREVIVRGVPNYYH